MTLLWVAISNFEQSILNILYYAAHQCVDVLPILAIGHLGLISLLPLKGPNGKSGSPCRSSTSMRRSESPSHPLVTYRPVCWPVFDLILRLANGWAKYFLPSGRVFGPWTLCTRYRVLNIISSLMAPPRSLQRSLSEALCNMKAHVGVFLLAFMDNCPVVLGLFCEQEVVVVCLQTNQLLQLP